MEATDKKGNIISRAFESKQKSRQLKQNKVLSQIQNDLKENKKLQNRSRSQLAVFLGKFLNDEEKKTQNEVLKKFQKQNVWVFGLSIINIFVLSLYVKRFWEYSNFKKFLFGAVVFSACYKIGTYEVTNKKKKFDEEIIEKYKNLFLSYEFNLDK